MNCDIFDVMKMNDFWSRDNRLDGFQYVTLKKEITIKLRGMINFLWFASTILDVTEKIGLRMC